MPIHSWNWFRAVGVGNDLKSWYGDNPQVSQNFYWTHHGVIIEFKEDLNLISLPRSRMAERAGTRSLMMTSRVSTRTRSTS